jgi:hypothetical protein
MRVVGDRRARKLAGRLNKAVRALAPDVRRAMLTALDDEQVIIGAYTDRHGRVCPMLAAHRRGARNQVGDFPRAWDAFGRARRPRAASERELEVLRALLEETVAAEPHPIAEPVGATHGVRTSDQPHEAAHAGA